MSYSSLFDYMMMVMMTDISFTIFISIHNNDYNKMVLRIRISI